jgi:hypothetical protein
MGQLSSTCTTPPLGGGELRCPFLSSSSVQGCTTGTHTQLFDLNVTRVRARHDTVRRMITEKLKTYKRGPHHPGVVRLAGDPAPRSKLSLPFWSTVHTPPRRYMIASASVALFTWCARRCSHPRAMSAWIRRSCRLTSPKYPRSTSPRATLGRAGALLASSLPALDFQLETIVLISRSGTVLRAVRCCPRTTSPPVLSKNSARLC